MKAAGIKARHKLFKKLANTVTDLSKLVDLARHCMRQSDVFILTESLMNYAILIYIGSQAQTMRRDPQQHAVYFPPWMAYAHAVRDAGIHIGGSGLELAETATAVRIRNGERDVQDGPFAETKEQLAGFFLIDVPDLDKALDWAARCPVLPGDVVEVRPCLRQN